MFMFCVKMVAQGFKLTGSIAVVYSIFLVMYTILNFCAYADAVMEATQQFGCPNLNKIIQRHGYPAESHEVTTEDGFILTLHRIPHGKHGYSEPRPPPIYFQHGLLGSSADWIVNGPEKSLPYLFADKGHDIWLGNARGNTYSRAHVSLSPDNTAFWNFTFHEMGVYDLPAELDFIMKTTGEEKLYYIGHSMGTTMFYVLCSIRPEYNEKIITMFSLAPVAFMSNAKSPVRFFAPYSKDIQLISNWFGDGEFLPRNAFINFVLKHTCEMTVFEVKICENNIFIICGHDPDQFNATLLPVIFGHTPAGTSTKTLAHYAQEIQSGMFRGFDYGTEGNRIVYNQDVPLNYNLSLVTVPISLHYADNDLLANVKDVKRLAESLPNVIEAFRVDFPKFNHLDFLWSKDINRLLNDKIVSMIDGIEEHGEIPTGSGLAKEVEMNEIDDEPNFNDISSLLKHKAYRFGKGYADEVLQMKLAVERKIRMFTNKSGKTIRKHLKSFTNMFQRNKLDEDVNCTDVNG